MSGSQEATLFGRFVALFLCAHGVGLADTETQIPVVVPQQYLVERGPGVTTAQLVEGLKAKLHGSIQIVGEIPDRRLVQIHVTAPVVGPSPEELAESQVSGAATLQSLDSVEPVVRFRLVNVPGSAAEAQSAIGDVMTRIQMSGTNGLSQGKPSKPIIVAVIDSGIYSTHEVFKGLLLPGVDATVEPPVSGAEAVQLPGAGASFESHGTSTAGVIALMIRGGDITAAPLANVKILPIKATDSNEIIESLSAIRAIDFAVQSGATVINASWGEGVTSNKVEEAVNRARIAHVTFVAAAGNGAQKSRFDPYIGYDIDQNPFYPASWNLSNMIAVGALGTANSLAQFSNFGHSTVKLAAPGYLIMVPTIGIDENTRAKYSAYQVNTGTSISAPFVTGALALYTAAFPSADQAAIISRIESAVVTAPELQSVVASGGYLSLQQIFASQPSAAPSSQPPSYVPVRTPQYDIRSALKQKMTIGEAQAGTAPILAGFDAGNPSQNPRRFVVEVKKGSDPKAVLKNLSTQCGISQPINRINNNLFEVQLPAESSGKQCSEKDLKSLQGVKSAEAAVAFKLQE